MKQINNTLYKQTSTGSVNQWSVYVGDQTGFTDKVYVEWGQVGGVLSRQPTTCIGKNIGKANETTPSEQAVLEATSKWEKQKKKGYVEDPSGKSDKKLPMKVLSYFDKNNKDKVEFPCTISPKLNGVNGECRILEDGSFVQLSRGGEEYPNPPEKAVEELKGLMSALGVKSLNYEIYKHGEHLQDIQGAVKAPKNHTELWEQLEYHVFDLPDFEGTWQERSEALFKGFSGEYRKGITHDFIKYVPTINILSHENLIKYQDLYVSQGYEGSVVRNLKGLYKYNIRSPDVFKVKYVQSEEFLVESYVEDKNHHPVFTCKLNAEEGNFKVKPKGTKEHRSKVLSEADSWIDKWMTVEYEMLSKSGVPLKPVGIGLREGYVDEESGKFVVVE